MKLKKWYKVLNVREENIDWHNCESNHHKNKHFSSITAMEDYDDILEYPMKVISLVFYYLTLILCVPENTFVLYVAGFKMKRTINTVGFLSLAIVDLLCCLSTLFYATRSVEDKRWPYGSIMCKILPFIMLITMFASVFTLSLISDHTGLGSKTLQSVNCTTVLCSGLVLASVLSLPFMMLRDTYTVYNRTLCLHDEQHYEMYGRLIIIRFVFGFLVPLICITTCYGFIARKLGRSHFHSGRTFRIILAVIVAFFLCWLPYHTVDLIIMYGEKSSYWIAVAVYPLTISLAYFNSCLNPILYVFMGQDFKSNVKLSLRRVFERIFSEEGTQMLQTTQSLQMHSLQHFSSITALEDYYYYILEYPMKVSSLVFYYLTLILCCWIEDEEDPIADLLCCLSTLFYALSVEDKHTGRMDPSCARFSPSLCSSPCLPSGSVYSGDHTGLGSKSSQSVNCTTVLCSGLVLASVLSLPFMMLRDTYTVYNRTLCLHYQPDEEHNKMYGRLIIIRFVFGFLVPLICITTCYGFIARKLGRSHFHSGRAFRIMLAVIVALFLCWLPYHTVDLIIMYGEESSYWTAVAVDPLAISLAYFNSCLNPILYVFMGWNFKSNVKLSLRRVFERVFSEEGTQMSQTTQTLPMQSV
ncbi:C3a anaphylatoxin chemotactic receptor [Labeo rohita]|uniref:C3a anaphylatoxin chemotactic receptor n=1 Tax=Labeo rohita TaxID=84645 RepID=A0ABQ8L425_LABRO|nr:C3a anaphylatoxin chemotactic receptor [Labeo rohita]